MTESTHYDSIYTNLQNMWKDSLILCFNLNDEDSQANEIIIILLHPFVKY